METGGAATDLGFLMSNISVIQDFVILFFELYHECYFELLIIQVGKITTNTSSSGDLVKKLGFELWEYFTSETGLWHNLDNITAWGAEGTVDMEDADAVAVWFQYIGKYLGIIASEFFEFTIPVFNLNEFEKGGHSLLEH